MIFFKVPMLIRRIRRIFHRYRAFTRYYSSMCSRKFHGAVPETKGQLRLDVPKHTSTYG